MHIILATPYDIEAARSLINEVFPLRQYILRKDRELIPKKQSYRLSPANSELWLLRNSDTIIGTVLLMLGTGQQKDFAEIRYLTVHPKWQGQYLGNRLVSHVENRARDHQKKKMLLSTIYYAIIGIIFEHALRR